LVSRGTRWLGLVVLVSGGLAAVPGAAWGASEPAECVGWAASVAAVTAVGPGQLTVEESVSHFGPTATCHADVWLAGYRGTPDKAHWRTDGQTGLTFVSARGATENQFSGAVTVEAGTYAVCVVTPYERALDCVGVTVPIDQATGQAGTPQVHDAVDTPTDKSGTKDDGGGACGLCV
jgi:hypothetical protein